MNGLRKRFRRIRQLRPLWGQIVLRFFKALLLWIYKVPFHHCIYVKIPISCRLGNQMFITAFGETVKKQMGEKCDVVYYTYGLDYYLQDIDPWIFSRFSIMTFYIPNLILVEEPSTLSNTFFYSIKDSLKEGNILLSGFFENIQLFDFNLVRKLHKRPIEVTKKINSYYGDLSTCASIHVRRGDFVNMGVALGATYYKQAMSKFPDDTVFIVISDDIQWCKDNLISKDFNIIFADKHHKEKDLVYLDLFLPTLCLRGNIMSCSSFSWWGSMLSDSGRPIRIMPTPWWTGETNKPLYFEDAIILNSKI